MVITKDFWLSPSAKYTRGVEADPPPLIGPNAGFSVHDR